MADAKVIPMAPPTGFLDDMERLFDELVAPQDEPATAHKGTYTNLDEALAPFGEVDPKAYTRLKPEPPQNEVREQTLNPVERMLTEEKLLSHTNPEVRRGAADDLVELAEDEETTLPSVCRIRDMLAFANKKRGGEEFAPQLRLVKKALSLKVREAEESLSFETRKTPPYTPELPHNQPRKAVIITKPQVILR